MAVRDVAVQLRGSHLHDTDHHAADRREGASRSSSGSLERGAKVVLVRPAPVPGFRGTRSFALPEFDPFWKRVVEADILVALHSSDSGYEQIANGWVGSDSEMLPFKPDAFRMLSSWRPIEDAVASLDHPRCAAALPRAQDRRRRERRLVGAPLQQALKDLYKKMPQDFPEEPIVAMRRNIHISPFWEEDSASSPSCSAPERVLFGSDYPHPEGLGNPVALHEQRRAPRPDDWSRQDHGRQPRPADERREHPASSNAAAAN